jgi:hypothetical protein
MRSPCSLRFWMPPLSFVASDSVNTFPRQLILNMLSKKNRIILISTASCLFYAYYEGLAILYVFRTEDIHRNVGLLTSGCMDDAKTPHYILRTILDLIEAGYLRAVFGTYINGCVQLNPSTYTHKLTNCIRVDFTKYLRGGTVYCLTTC